MAFPFPLFVHPEWHVQAVRRGTKDTAGSSLPPNEFRKEKTFGFAGKNIRFLQKRPDGQRTVFSKTGSLIPVNFSLQSVNSKKPIEQARIFLEKAVAVPYLNNGQSTEKHDQSNVKETSRFFKKTGQGLGNVFSKTGSLIPVNFP